MKYKHCCIFDIRYIKRKELLPQLARYRGQINDIYGRTGKIQGG